MCTLHALQYAFQCAHTHMHLNTSACPRSASAATARLSAIRTASLMACSSASTMVYAHMAYGIGM